MSKSTRYWQPWNATPDAADPCPKYNVWLLYQSGRCEQVGCGFSRSDIFGQKRNGPKLEIVAYYRGYLPPRKDDTGHWLHDGSETSPVADDARVSVSGERKGAVGLARSIHWGGYTSFKPVWG